MKAKIPMYKKDDSMHLRGQYNYIGMLALLDQWIGFYPTPEDAIKLTNRKLYMGFATQNSTTFDFSNNIASENRGFRFAWKNGGKYIDLVDNGTGHAGIETDTNWLRAPYNGMLPHAYDNSNAGVGSLGTSSWYWKNAYIANLYISNSITYGGMSVICSQVYSNAARISKMLFATNGSSKYVEVSTPHRTDGTVWGVTAWASDKSLKENIKDTEIRHVLDKISQLKHVEFDWKDDTGHVPLGYIADEVGEVLPCLTFDVEQTDEDGNVIGALKHIDHTRMIPLITMGMQELIEENKWLWEFNNAMVDEIISIRNEMNELKNVLMESNLKNNL